MEGLKVKEFLAREGERLGIRNQEELASALGFSDQTISNWVKGKTFPTHETEDRLLKMGMTVEELFGYPYPSSAGELNRQTSLWELMESNLQDMVKKITIQTISKEMEDDRKGRPRGNHEDDADDAEGNRVGNG